MDPRPRLSEGSFIQAKPMSGLSEGKGPGKGTFSQAGPGPCQSAKSFIHSGWAGTWKLGSCRALVLPESRGLSRIWTLRRATARPCNGNEGKVGFSYAAICGDSASSSLGRTAGTLGKSLANKLPKSFLPSSYYTTCDGSHCLLSKFEFFCSVLSALFSVSSNFENFWGKRTRTIKKKYQVLICPKNNKSIVFIISCFTFAW